MLPKTSRIERKKFPELIAKGKRYSSKYFLMHLCDLPTSTKSRKTIFSFSVSKKVQKSAVKRNFLRRRGYSIVSKIKQSIKDGYMILFVYKQNPSNEYSHIESDLKELLSKASMII